MNGRSTGHTVELTIKFPFRSVVRVQTVPCNGISTECGLNTINSLLAITLSSYLSLVSLSNRRPSITVILQFSHPC